MTACGRQAALPIETIRGVYVAPKNPALPLATENFVLVGTSSRYVFGLLCLALWLSYRQH